MRSAAHGASKADLNTLLQPCIVSVLGFSSSSSSMHSCSGTCAMPEFCRDAAATPTFSLPAPLNSRTKPFPFVIDTYTSLRDLLRGVRDMADHQD